MSFSRFGLLRGRQRLVGGLARPVLNGMPLVHQRLSGGGSSKYFDGVGSTVVGAIIGGIVGASATGYVGFRNYKQKKDFDESRKFEKFLKGHHVPQPEVPYQIERQEIEQQVRDDILQKARANQVVNIVGPKNLGKSVAVKKSAKLIVANNYRDYKVFYIDASQTFTTFLKTWYDLDYDSEWEAVNDWMKSLGRYAAQNPRPRILVILDSPGSWEEELTEKQLKKVMRFMKGSVASMGMTFYCVSSPDIPATEDEPKKIKNIFTKDRIAVFGSRFEEIEHEDWGIDFTLDSNEKEQLISKYEAAYPSVKLSKQQKEKLRLNSTKAIGLFVKNLAHVK